MDAITGVTLADAVAKRDRYVSALLAALDDVDGRVRRAAVDAFDTFAVGLAVVKLGSEQERIGEALATLASGQSRDSVQTPRQCDALDRLGVDGVLFGE